MRFDSNSNYINCQYMYQFSYEIMRNDPNLYWIILRVWIINDARLIYVHFELNKRIDTIVPRRWTLSKFSSCAKWIFTNNNTHPSSIVRERKPQNLSPFSNRFGKCFANDEQTITFHMLPQMRIRKTNIIYNMKIEFIFFRLFF